MKITSINDIDLTQYRLAFYHGDSTNVESSYERALKLADAGIADDMEHVHLYLIPKDRRITEIWGDDFDDAPAHCNAGFPSSSSLPKGSLLLEGVLGGELKLTHQY